MGKVPRKNTKKGNSLKTRKPQRQSAVKKNVGLSKNTAKLGNKRKGQGKVQPAKGKTNKGAVTTKQKNAKQGNKQKGQGKVQLAKGKTNKGAVTMKQKGQGKVQPPKFKTKKLASKAKQKPLTLGKRARQALAYNNKMSAIAHKRNEMDKIEDKRLVRTFKQYGKTKATKKAQKPADIEPTELVNTHTVQTAISGLKKLSAKVQEGKINSLHDVTDEQEDLIFLQVSLCKLPKTTLRELHLVKPMTISVHLPNSIVTDSTEVVLITKDLERGIRLDHEDSLNHFRSLLHRHGAASLVNEIIPLRQLKVDYKEFEAKRHLANRTDVVLCDDTVVRFVPKFLGKHFYNKRKVPVQVDLKAEDLQNELLRGLAVSRLLFSMKGTSSIMKIGRLRQTDEEVQENILAAVKKISQQALGGWSNIQNLSIKAENSMSIPVYVKLDPLNAVDTIMPRPLYKNMETVSDTLSTQSGKRVNVYPDGSVTVIGKAPRDKPPKAKSTAKEKTKEDTAKSVEIKKNEVEKPAKKGKEAKKKPEPKTKKKSSTVEKLTKTHKLKAESVDATPESGKKRKAETKKGKPKKQKVESDSEGEEEELAATELAYLKRLTQGEAKQKEKGKKAKGRQNKKGKSEEEDVWAMESDSSIEGSDYE